MDTKIWKISSGQSDKYLLQEAADLLKAGEIIGFPTETVYGLGANALDSKAVEKIFIAKGRPADNPLIVHVHSVKQVPELVREISPIAVKVMDKFWPGPLTIVLPKAPIIPEIITGGLDTVAIRIPAHPVALRLIETAGIPIAAPSANISGKPSPTTAQHVWQDLNGKIAGIIDGGKAGVGVESTVLDLSTDTPTILRPGGITREELQKEIGQVAIDTALYDLKAVPRSPGMKYTHYSPDAQVVIIQGPGEQIITKLKQLIAKTGKLKTGLLISQETYDSLRGYLPGNIIVGVLGPRNSLAELTANLFNTLRWFDRQGVDIIYAESYPEHDLGTALMNRLIKAAGGKTI
ncbi:MAG: L-threonylcarbamoyladenylate synthase [Peptococcaceae bacterium]